MVLRKLAVALLSIGVMLPGLGHALALSDLKTKSALGEPFLAEVDLSELGDLNADEIKISLASQEDFERVGVERVYFLTELKFDVVVNQGGRSFIRVTSFKPVHEPYLDFVIRVAWPGNARLQNVTALLDPPVVADANAPELNQAQSSAPAPVAEPVVTAPVAPPAEMATAPVAQPSPVVTAEPPKPVVTPDVFIPAPKPVRQEAPRPVPSVSSDGYRTQPGDTMSKIAQQFRPGDASAAQTMVAIQRANPRAFANNNINLLKRGQVLNIPTESQIREVSAQEAAAAIRQQADAWRATAAPAVAKPALEAQQVNATAKTEAPAVAAPVAAKPEMKLLAAQTGKNGSAAAGKESASAKPADAKRLDENKIKAEVAKGEKDKLATKVGTLDTQVKANDKQIALQNAKLAELQAKLKEEQAQKEAAAKLKAEPAKVDVAKAESAKKDAAGVAADAVAVEADLKAAAAKTPDAQPVPAATPAVKEKPVSAVKKVAVPEPVAEEGLPLGLIGGVVGVLALLGGGGFFWNQKRRRDQADEAAALAELEASDDSMGSDLPDAMFAGSHDDAQHEDLGLWSEEPASQSAPAQDRVLADPLEEVEQYIAFERYPQAVGFLNKAIASNPGRADLRLKLLEVYAHLDDHNGFAEQKAWFDASGDSQASSQIAALAAGMSPPPRAAAGKDDAIAFERVLVAEEDDLPSLEDMEMDFNATVSVSSPSLSAVNDMDLDLPSLDDDFSFDAPAATTAADSGLSLDESLDFSFDQPAEAAPAASLDDDFSFELDTDAFDSKPVAKAESFAADEAMDFSLDDGLSLPEETGAASAHGFGELADFDAAPELKPVEVVTNDDDLSFSLDDLEADAGAMDFKADTSTFDLGADTSTDTGTFDLSADANAIDLDGDFSLDDGKAGAADFSFDETLQMDSGLNDVVADFDSGLRSTDAAPAVAKAEPAPAPAVALAGDLGMDDEFDFLADTDENATKLDLARAYIDMGDMEGARDILQEVLNEGSASQKDEAKALMTQAA